MIFRKIATAIAALSLVASAPAMSQTVPQRESAELSEASDLRGGWLIAGLAVLAVVILLVLVLDDNDTDAVPLSP